MPRGSAEVRLYNESSSDFNKYMAFSIRGRDKQSFDKKVDTFLERYQGYIYHTGPRSRLSISNNWSIIIYTKPSLPVTISACGKVL